MLDALSPKACGFARCSSDLREASVALGPRDLARAMKRGELANLSREHQRTSSPRSFSACGPVFA